MPISKDPEKRAKQIAQLRPIQPGERLNPGGRPKMKPVRDALVAAGSDERFSRLAETIWKNAIKGEPFFVQFLADRIEGKLLQRAEVTGPDGQPLQQSPIVSLTTEELRRLIAAQAEGEEAPYIEGTARVLPPGTVDGDDSPSRYDGVTIDPGPAGADDPPAPVNPAAIGLDDPEWRRPPIVRGRPRARGQA